MLRLVLRAWREVRDGVQAGTAKWEARWEHDAAECALARRVRFSPSGDDDTAQVTQEAFFGEAAWQLRVLLAFMRLVRAGPVADARRRSPTWQHAQHERRLRALQLSWEHAMPGERSQKYSWREEAAMSEAHGVTSGAAAVRVTATATARAAGRTTTAHAEKSTTGVATTNIAATNRVTVPTM